MEIRDGSGKLAKPPTLDLSHATTANVWAWAKAYHRYRQGLGDDPGPEPTLDLQGNSVSAGEVAKILKLATEET